MRAGDWPEASDCVRLGGPVSGSSIYARLDSAEVVNIGLVAATLKFQLSG